MQKINEDLMNIDWRKVMYLDDRDIVQAKLVAEMDESTEADSLWALAITQNDGVMLRGSLYPSGAIHSFWVKTNQKNLLAMYFQLPVQAVAIGDSWELDINYIGNDQNFICDDSRRRNRVTLLDVKNIDGNQVALLKYEIVEYVSGLFNSPLQDEDSPQNLEMEFSFQALAEFSITEGRWMSYEGILEQHMSGLYESSSTQKISLIPES